MSASDRDALRTLERDLKLTIFGQDRAIEALAGAIKMSRSGLREEEKPIGAFLFAGPTGVGKTEVTRQLALLMGVELIRFDMSEYMETHTVSRLIGAPPGYVGFDQGGLLTEAVTRIRMLLCCSMRSRKAHPEVFNLLLQVMDHGTLTDNNGRKADFRNVILVMTTNAGAQEMSRASIGFTKQDHTADGMSIIKKQFSPEFRNRLDAIIQFAALELDSIMRVVDKLVVELEAKLGNNNVTLELDDDAREWIREARLRPENGRAPDGAHYPGAHQTAAGRGAAVRQPREWRTRQNHRRQGRRSGTDCGAGAQGACAPARGSGNRSGGGSARVNGRGRRYGPCERSYGVSSTVTLSPVRIRM